MTKYRGLGKGLSALMGETSVDLLERPQDASSGLQLNINQLVPGIYQPRKSFTQNSLAELASSIAAKGVILPIIVREVDGDYQIIAGERRWRASKMAGLAKVPVIVMELSDKEALEFAIIENIQRENLTPIEEAESFQKLIAEFDYTQEYVANSIGKSRSYVTNLLRLLNLPEQIREMINDGRLSVGHARTLVNLDNAESIAERIIAEGLSVRQTEHLVAKMSNQGEKTARKRGAALPYSTDIALLEQSITEHLGMKVKISSDGKRGIVTICYNNLMELDGVIQRLSN